MTFTSIEDSWYLVRGESSDQMFILKLAHVILRAMLSGRVR